MTDIRQALEEAFKVIHPAPRPIRHAYQPDGSHWPGDGIGPYTEEYGAWSKVLARFRRFLDAEAWTDAAMMLVPEGWGWNVSQPNAKAIASGLLKKHTPVRGEVENGFERRFIVAGETPALALAQACLKARENGDG